MTLWADAADIDIDVIPAATLRLIKSEKSIHFHMTLWWDYQFCFILILVHHTVDEAQADSSDSEVVVLWLCTEATSGGTVRVCCLSHVTSDKHLSVNYLFIGKHANSTQKGPGQELNPEPSCCVVTVPAIFILKFILKWCAVACDMFTVFKVS